jgi:hypothetical protein
MVVVDEFAGAVEFVPWCALPDGMEEIQKTANMQRLALPSFDRWESHSKAVSTRHNSRCGLATDQLAKPTML